VSVKQSSYVKIFVISSIADADCEAFNINRRFAISATAAVVAFCPVSGLNRMSVMHVLQPFALALLISPLKSILV
jgi:hypothetical protein